MPTSDFWGYFEPIRQNMPANCSADVQAVIAHVDSVLLSNNTADITNLKTMFGLQGLSHNDDFAAARMSQVLSHLCLDCRVDMRACSSTKPLLVAKPRP